MKRRRLTQLNILVSLLHQLAMLISGLVLPRYILLGYGSAVNGLMQSISQMLTYTTLMEFGIGGAVVATLYKPLAEGDGDTVSGIFNYTKKFFSRICVVFVLFSLILSVSTKYILCTDFDFIYVSSLVLILAINTYFNYYFGLPHQLLMKADQKLFVVQSVQIITTLANLIFCIIAIKSGATIHTVKFITAFVFLLNPVVYRIYVKKHYDIKREAYIEKKQMSKTKNAIVHHWAYFIHRNTDVVILSVVRGVKSASVYSVYNAVILVLENLLNSISTAVAGAVGNMIAKDEKHSLGFSFSLYEMFNTYFTAAFSTVAAILIMPFVQIYTWGINDVNYIEPIFACFMILSGVMNCLRIPYNTVVTSAGHYKETRMGAIGEVVINLTLSLALVKPMGLLGVALGTFCAMSFRTVYLVWYLSKNILNRPKVLFVKSFIINAITSLAILLFSYKFLSIGASNFIQLALYAIPVSVVVFIILGSVNVLINIKTIKSMKNHI